MGASGLDGSFRAQKEESVLMIFNGGEMNWRESRAVVYEWPERAQPDQKRRELTKARIGCC